jgi:mono/diheme cytochrome c family protein
MNFLKQPIFIICILFGVNVSLLAEATANEERGGLLYSIHCSTCHNSTIHWRDKMVVTDWESLKTQVKLWQSFSDLGWSEEDIIDVASYLNTHYYNFTNPEPKIITIKK